MESNLFHSGRSKQNSGKLLICARKNSSLLQRALAVTNRTRVTEKGLTRTPRGNRISRKASYFDKDLERFAMNRARLLAVTLCLIFMGLAVAGFLMAQTPSSPALAGKVSPQAEGTMEGVLIGAKKVGSTITTWVVSNAQGEYKFPRERLTPGKYAISMRAVGYELP